MLSRSEQKRLRSLKRRKYREGEGLFLAEGVRLVEAMLDAGVAPRLVVASPTLEDTERGRRLAERLAGLDVLRRVEDRVLAEFAATESPQGVLAVAEIPRHDLGAIRVEGPATVLVLDGVQDPGNFGTLVRTADAFGAAFVAVLPGTVDPWNPKSVRAAAGAAFRIPIVQTDLDTLLEWLHRHGFALYGAAAEGRPVDEVRPPQRAALAVGNEGAGLGAAVRAAAEELLAVPIRPEAESLNVAVAAAVLLFLLTRTGGGVS
ncbi:MAG: RNA methyltransferase [bacterium]|nr:MAG: RNA methyltransferase [bacterium]